MLGRERHRSQTPQACLGRRSGRCGPLAENPLCARSDTPPFSSPLPQEDPAPRSIPPGTYGCAKTQSSTTELLNPRRIRAGRATRGRRLSPPSRRVVSSHDRARRASPVPWSRRPEERWGCLCTLANPVRRPRTTATLPNESRGTRPAARHAASVLPPRIRNRFRSYEDPDGHKRTRRKKGPKFPAPTD